MPPPLEVKIRRTNRQADRQVHAGREHARLTGHARRMAAGSPSADASSNTCIDDLC